MKTYTSLVDDVFEKEGDVYAEPPTIDQPTGRGGITLAVYQQFCDVMQPGRRVTKLDLRTLTHVEARAIVMWYLTRLEKEIGLPVIAFQPLRLQMLDFAYNSSGPRAVRWLQRCLRCPVTGFVDPRTTQALGQQDNWLVHQALIAARLQMIDSWTDAPANQKYEEGLENRALTFSLLQI